jgi:tRNA threonylcarbamoyladenosine biosynthesis protein TsaB
VNVLSIDTATELLGIGVLVDGGQWYELSRKAGLNHAGFVMVAVDRTLSDAGLQAADLDLVVCAKGPGSFTGLRIGMATAKGLAAGADIPLVSVPTLDAMAWRLGWYDGTVIPLVDARKNSLYAAAYRGGERIAGPVDVPLGKVAGFAGRYSDALITGPAAQSAAEAAAAGASAAPLVDTCGGYGWNRGYVELGLETYRRNGPAEPDEGPEYVRMSDAELNLQRRRNG